MREPALQEIIQFISTGKQSGSVYGLKGSAGSYVVASCVKRGSPTIIRVEPDSDAAAISVMLGFSSGWMKPQI